MSMPSKNYGSRLCAVGVFVGAVLTGVFASPFVLNHAVAATALVKGQSQDTEVSHRAIYDFKLSAVESGAGISGIRGKMFYEQKDECDAITSEHRFNAEYQYPERPAVLTTSKYSSWEGKGGRQFYFNSDRADNGVMTEQLRGGIEQGAEKKDDKAVYSKPEETRYDLPEDYFLPVAHTSEIIRRAKQGETIFNAVVFDGTDADGPVEINTIIGKKATADEIAAIAKQAEGASNDEDNKIARPAKIDAALLVPEAWHVRMAVFPLKNNEDMLPSYEMDIILHANGVVSKVVVDYRVFKVAQTLRGLEPVKNKPCK